MYTIHLNFFRFLQAEKLLASMVTCPNIFRMTMNTIMYFFLKYYLYSGIMPNCCIFLSLTEKLYDRCIGMYCTIVCKEKVNSLHSIRHVYFRHHLTTNTNEFHLPFSSVDCFLCGHCFGDFQNQFIIQYISPFVKIKNWNFCKNFTQTIHHEALF